MGRLRNIRPQVGALGSAVPVLAPRAASGSWQRDHADERAFLRTAAWQRLRWAVLVRDAFTCQWPGCGRIEADTSRLVADHIVPVRVAPERKWDMANLQCLCATCHSGPKQAREVAIWGPAPVAPGEGGSKT